LEKITTVYKPDPKSQFSPITKEMIEGFRKRMENIRAKDPRQYIDSGPVGIFSALYALYSKGHFTVLNAALNEVERLYEFFESNKPSENNKSSI
jgi:hypothetical protein